MMRATSGILAPADLTCANATGRGRSHRRTRAARARTASVIARIDQALDEPAGSPRRSSHQVRERPNDPVRMDG